MLQPVVRRTWGPKGHTPILYSWDRHDRLSIAGAIALAPSRRRLSLYFHIQRENIRAESAAQLVVRVRRAVRRRLLVLWDRWNVHRKAARLLAARFGRQIAFEWLPPYSPDLNPVEGVWNHAKYADLANFVPDDIEHLHKQLAASLHDQRSTTSLLRSFFDHAGLTL
jgi:transposase